MRIIIEFEDRGETPMIREEPGAEKPSHVEVLDGGAPPESLLQLPPRWLVEAIQGATPPEVEETGECTDAGAAPDIQV
jgi:hypothetical protein